MQWLRDLLRQPAWRGIGLGLGCAVVAWLLAQLATFRGLEDWLLDGCFFYRGSRPTTARVVIVALDDDTLAHLDKPTAFLSPELAQVVTHVNQQGAAAVGLDLFVPQALSTLNDIQTAGAVGDARPLGAAILQAGNVVLPQWQTADGWQQPLFQWQLKALTQPQLGDLAFVNCTEDDDQFLRRQQLLIRDDNQGAVPQFALAVFARARKQAIAWDDAARTLRVGDQGILLDGEQKLRINYVGPAGTFPRLPFRTVFEAAKHQRPLPEVKDAIVLIGLTAGSGQDYHATPFANHYARWLASSPPAGLMPGTEVQANIIATLHDQAYIRTPLSLAALPWLLVLGVILGRAFAVLNLEWGLLLAVGHHFVWKALALLAFTWGSFRVEMVGMLLLGFLAYATTFALRWRALRRMFGVVKSEAIALALESDPRRLDLGGEEREVTVLFADIRDFTTFSENHNPHEVVALLNAYFTAVVPLIEAEEGTINTYMGDGIMVLFGAPANCPGHALRAVQAAVAMVRRVHELKPLWKQLDNEKMRIGVGVHTGKVVVGAIGSPRRLDYTAIGDTVNAAARIEAENKHFGTEILISAETYAALPDVDRARLGCTADPVESKVKGKTTHLFLHVIPVDDPTHRGGKA